MSEIMENNEIETNAAAEDLEKNIEVNDTILTDDQVSHIYNELEKDNISAENLAKAQELTENTEYDNIEEIIQDKVEQELPPENILKEAIKSANPDMPDEDYEQILKLLIEYKKNKNPKYTIYDKLPDSFKKVVDDYKFNINQGRPKNQLIGRELIAKMFFDTIIDDAQFDAIFDEFNRSMDEAYKEFGVEMTNLFDDAYKELFENIENIKAEDPEKGEKLQKVKDAFDDARSLNRLLEWVEPRRRRKLYKEAELRFSQPVSYFNSKVNTTDVKIPDVGKLLGVLKLYVPERSELELKRFIVAICEHGVELNMDDLADLAYVYKLVDNIYKYQFIPPVLEDEETKALFQNVSKVIDKINSLQGGN